MNASLALLERAENKCELCSSEKDIDVHIVAPKIGDKDDDCIIACAVCRNQLSDPSTMDENHWRCLNECMWSQVPAVQVLSYRCLDHLKAKDWAADLLNMIYLDEDNLEWAQAGLTMEGDIVHKDSNGNILSSGDSVVLIKDLQVKGANFTAKRGTAVRRISLVHDNPEHIEGKVNDQHIVILTKFVKKS